MSTLRVRSTASLYADSGVERAGATSAPSAFRIWRAGANPTDHGTHIFSAESAAKLMAEQATRGNLYSIDVDHLSVDNPQAPPEARKAVGWHRLEVRQTANGPELWATDVQWTDAVRAGLEKHPPEWRYFSPAYEVAKKSGEIVSYLNTALTNNPATWSVTALASRVAATKGSAMKYTDILAALMGEDGDAKSAAIAHLAAAFPDKEPDGDEGGEKKEKKETKAAEEPSEKKEEKKATADDGDGDEEKKAAISATKELVAQNLEMSKRLGALEATKLAEDRKAILATRKDLPAELVKTLEKMPIALMRETIASIPVATPDPAAADKVQATRGMGRDGAGDSQAYGSVRASRLPAEQRQELRERMGTAPAQATIGWDKDHPNDLVFPQITKAQARAILAKRAAEGTDGAPVNPADRRAQGGAR